MNVAYAWGLLKKAKVNHMLDAPRLISVHSASVASEARATPGRGVSAISDG